MIRLCGAACLLLAIGCPPFVGAMAQAPGMSLPSNEPNQINWDSRQASLERSDLQRPSDGNDPAARPRGNPLGEIPLAALPATRERPIFNPSRRAPAPALAPAPLVEPAVEVIVEPRLEHPLFTLVGTVVGQAENLAVFFDETAKAVIRLHIGEAEAGWVLQSVNLRATTLEKNGQRVTLALPAPSLASTLGAAPAMPPPPSGMTSPKMRPPRFPRSARINSEF